MTNLTQRPKLGLCRRLALIENNGRIGAPAPPIDLEGIEDRLHRLRQGYEWI